MNNQPISPEKPSKNTGKVSTNAQLLAQKRNFGIFILRGMLSRMLYLRGHLSSMRAVELQLAIEDAINDLKSYKKKE